MQNKSPSPRGFISAFGAHWFTKMSGPLTVPFTIAALFVPSAWLKALFAALAIICGAAASYAIWAKEREALNTALGRIETLESRRPDIDVRIMAAFWDSTCPAGEGVLQDSSCMYVRLKLVNRKDVPCTVDKFWMLGEKNANFQPKFLGLAIRGILKHSSMYGGNDTRQMPSGKETIIEPFALESSSPLIMACAQEGWVQFRMMGYSSRQKGTIFRGGGYVIL